MVNFAEKTNVEHKIALVIYNLVKQTQLMILPDFAWTSHALPLKPQESDRCDELPVSLHIVMDFCVTVM